MSPTESLLESWDRQCRIVLSAASLVDESNRQAKPSEDGWDLATQLAHIHEVRQFWLTKLDADRAKVLPNSFSEPWTTPISDLSQIKDCLELSGPAIRNAMADHLMRGTQAIGGYDHPVLFLQHIIWHEGWHIGLIFLALRLNGQEPSEEWSEENVWGLWRREEW